jgi:hypothetical protein
VAVIITHAIAALARAISADSAITRRKPATNDSAIAA